MWNLHDLVGSDPIAFIGVLLVGVVAGFFNVTAGGGSTLTLPLLMLVGGLPGPVANGTNRVAIIVQNLVAVPTFRKGGVRGMRATLPLIACALPGTLLGAYLGVTISDELFRRVLGVVMISLAAIIVFSGRRGTDRADELFEMRSPWTRLAFAAIGFYAGFIQAGVGFLIIFALSGIEHLPLVRVHALKVGIVLALQLAALPVFLAGDAVNWGLGLLLAAGLATGGFVGAKVTMKGSETLLRALLALGALGLSLKLLL